MDIPRTPDKPSKKSLNKVIIIIVCVFIIFILGIIIPIVIIFTGQDNTKKGSYNLIIYIGKSICLNELKRLCCLAGGFHTLEARILKQIYSEFLKCTL